MAPLGLLSLLAVLVPLAIHLLSRKPGKIVKVGHLQFLESSASSRFKSLKLSEWPLLLVRLALLTLLAFMLAQPLWREKTAGATPARTKVFVAPELLASHSVARAFLDSLAAGGHELYSFTAGFPALRSGEAFTSVFEGSHNWSLVRELDDRLPALAPIQVVAVDRLSDYRGERPSLRREVGWKTFAASTPRLWLHDARRFSQDSVRVVAGFSTPQQTRYASYSFRLPAHRAILAAANMPPLEYIPEAYQERAELRIVQQEHAPQENGIRLPLALDSLHIAVIYESERSGEAHYLQAALQVAAAAAGLPLRLIAGPPELAMPRWSELDLAFWLAEDVPAEAWRQIERGLVLLTAANDLTYQTCASWIVMPHTDEKFFPQLWRRVPASNLGAPIWTDGLGAPLLEAERRGAGWHYRFASRFDPAWNELVWHAAFPAWLLSVLQGEHIFHHYRVAKQDQRRLSNAQSIPHDNIAPNPTAPQTTTHDLHFPLWLLAVFIFGVERWMADRK